MKLGERVIAKAKVVEQKDPKGRTIVVVESFVNQELVFKGKFSMYRSKSEKVDKQ